MSIERNPETDPHEGSRNPQTIMDFRSIEKMVKGQNRNRICKHGEDGCMSMERERERERERARVWIVGFSEICGEK